GSGPAFCYCVDAVSWLAMIAALRLMGPMAEPAGGRRPASLQSLGEGLQFVWTHPVLLCMMGLDFGQNFFSNPRALLPIYARDILHVGAEGLGVLYAATSAGALVMALVMSVHGHIRKAGVWVLVGVATYGLCTAVFALSQ